MRSRLAALLPSNYSIAAKLSLVFTLLVSSGMGLLGLFIVHNQSEVLEQQIAESGATVLRQMADFSRDPLLANDQLGLELIVNNLAAEQSVLGVALFDEKRVAIEKKGLIPGGEQLTNALGRVERLMWSRTSGLGQQENLISFVTPIEFKGLIVGYALITYDRSVSTQARQQIIQAVAGATLLLVLLGIIASFVLGRRLTRPIHQLINAGKAISAGDYQVRFDDQRKDELGVLMQSLNEMSAGLLRKEQVEQAFSRYVSPKVARAVMENLNQVQLGGEHVDASVLFADIVGFTQLSEQLQPEEVNALLNEYFSIIAEVTHAYGGHIDKFIGDCVMLVFGVPEHEPQHTFQAATCAVAIQAVVGEHNRRRAQQGFIQVQFSIGVNSGVMLAGNMGAAERMDYTVVGDAVNVASRIAAAAGPGMILISDELNTALYPLGVVTSPFKTLKLKGKAHPVRTHQLIAFGEHERSTVEQTIDAVLNRDSGADLTSA